MKVAAVEEFLSKSKIMGIQLIPSEPKLVSWAVLKKNIANDRIRHIAGPDHRASKAQDENKTTPYILEIYEIEEKYFAPAFYDDADDEGKYSKSEIFRFCDFKSLTQFLEEIGADPENITWLSDIRCLV